MAEGEGGRPRSRGDAGGGTGGERLSGGTSSLSRSVSRTDLFLGFLKIGLLGFGGIAPWARHVIVEERAWLTEQEYASLLGIGQVLPGPNTMNTAVMLGDRLQGWIGAVLSLLGLMAMPLIILIALAALYGRFGSVPWVGAAVAGAAASAAGLVIGTGLKMVRNLRPSLISCLFGLLAFVGIGVLQLPLLPVVLVLLPLSIAGAAMERRR